MWEHDPRLEPTPDYGTMGPGADAKPGRSVTPQAGPTRGFAAVAIGVLAALVFVAANGNGARAAWQQLSQLLTPRRAQAPASTLNGRSLQQDSAAQKQAEQLLQQAIAHPEGADEQIAANAGEWRGKLRLNEHLNSLIETGFNASDLKVRAATIEIDLAAVDVAKTPEEFEHLVSQAGSGSQQQREWALWTVGLLGNRGIEPERAAQVLVSHLQDPNPQVRHWVVEGLAYLGTDDAIEPLLKTLRADPSPMVRERAACSLAQSGMLTREQRRTVVPKLLEYVEDATLDSQTRAWVFHSLRDITGQTLPDDAAAWRTWYSSQANY